MSNKHTPGPWGQSTAQIVASDTKHICDVMTGNAADVRLIAAAPDMAEALKPFSRMFLYPDDIEGHEDSDSGEHEELMVSRAHIRAARAALSKAGL